MVVVELNFSSYAYVLTGAVAVGGALYKYAKSKGLKVVSSDKIAAFKAKYAGLDELSTRISLTELSAIVKKAIELKNKEHRTAADVQELGKLIIDAIASEEST